YGTALSATQLDASSTVAGTFAYTPAAGTVLKAGSQTLSVTFTPTDATDYSTAKATVGLTVNQAAPAVTWAAPSAIVYGTALSATQLNASSTIPGAFVYSPAAGAILAVGSDTLSVTFTPTDSTDYTTATQTVTLTVNSGTPMLSVNATSVGFGDVALNTLATQTVTLTSSGTASVTVNSATVTGTGFSLAGSTFSATLTPGQTATLGVQFDPTTAVTATGQLTITSNSSVNGTVLIPLTGTGTAAAYSVNLGWDAPSGSADPIAGYHVYRAPDGSSMYQLLTSSVDTQTTYTDSTVQAGQTYDYIVASVDDSGVESAPTSPIAVTIP
ncbi:MAG: choice-of-anchor D domain-containing protein, partial [Terracidiphilus sp.]|nr:choice-of-anchor D domain-containing protein [Terracidiphilus sp.]